MQAWNTKKLCFITDPPNKFDQFQRLAPILQGQIGYIDFNKDHYAGVNKY